MSNTDRDPTNPEALAREAIRWLNTRTNSNPTAQAKRMADEADIDLDLMLIDQGVKTPDEAVTSFEDAEGFAVLVTLESGEWFTIDRQGNVLTN